MSLRRTVIATAQALRQRWLLPTLLVAVPLVWAQQAILPWNPLAMAMLAAACFAVLLVAPVSWQLLFPLEQNPLKRPWAIVLYLWMGMAGAWLGALVLGLDLDLWGKDPGSWFFVGVFLVAGFGLGRDVQLERSLAAQRARAEALALSRERAELRAIRSQLDPHFLFNTLNAIAEWVHDDPDVAERALFALAGLLRQALDGVQAERWPLGRELSLVEALGGLYRIRDEQRFRLEAVDWALSEELEAFVPPMLLLSLVENAFKHGPAQGHDGAVRVALSGDEEQVVVQIDNPGPFTGPRPGGQGLELARRRVALAWGDEGTLQIEDVGGATRTRLAFPGSEP